MAEGAPLLRAYRRNLIEGSNPSLSAIIKKPDLRRVFFAFGFSWFYPDYRGFSASRLEQTRELAFSAC